ncbi:uncharacterized protein LOC131145915 [Malania oleifera]|uniref:uncharacterized protein LOC131145915 n=1 Tax=Malania oleifera TaxID=397392 RepID=UPI0025AEAB7D|nr:uncharacterized protein LOC131145915 [Malania oleifera]
MRMNPPAFTGGPDPMVAENWVQEIEEIMVVLDCTDKQKVRYAAFKMTGEAKRWWLSAKLLEDQRGDMTIAEYATKFVELSCFAPFLVSNEVRKARKFKKCLRRMIYELVVGFQSIQGSTEPSEKKKRPAPSGFQSEASQRSAKKGKEIMVSVYSKCDKRHRGECWYDTLNCFRMDPKGNSANASGSEGAGPLGVAGTDYDAETEKVLAMLQCTEEQRFLFTTYRLKEEAERWWTTVRLLEQQRVTLIDMT